MLSFRVTGAADWYGKADQEATGYSQNQESIYCLHHLQMKQSRVAVMLQRWWHTTPQKLCAGVY